MMKRIFVIATVVIAGAFPDVAAAQTRGARDTGPTASVRGSRQIGSSAANTLGLRLGFSSSAFEQMSLSETAAKVDALGTGNIEGLSTQKTSPEIAKNFDFHLSADELAKVKNRLSELRLKMPGYRITSIPSDESSRRKLFEFAKNLGIETIVAPATTSALADVDKFASEFEVNFAIEGENPKTLMKSLEGRSKRVGVSADVSAWKRAGIKPVDGLRAVNDRLLYIKLSDPVTGSDGEVEKFFLELAKLNPPPTPPAPTCGDCAGPRVPVRPVFVTLGSRGDSTDKLAESAKAFESAVRAGEGHQIVAISKKTPITPTDQIPIHDRLMIQASVPRQALVKPKKTRKLLIVDLCPQGGFYHRTVAHANLALQLIAKNTGAYEPIFNNDLDNLKYPKIKEYDAVFLNSVVGPVFSDPAVIDGLTRFVREGGGVAGIHGSTYASTDVPEYGEMMGATTGPHRIEVATLKVDDPKSPLTKQFEGHDVVWVDEFYHFIPTGPYSRDKLHVLLSINMAKSDMSTPGQASRPDNDYGLAWVRSYGSGRVFNTALGHTPLLFATPQMAQMVFAGIQFVLGDLEADTTPSAKLAKR